MNSIEPISIIIPVYNEGASIVQTVSELESVIKKNNLQAEIIVVDDGSTDDTFSFIKKTNVKALKHPKNQGYGAALKTGIKASANELILIIDADLTYPVDQIPQLISKAKDFDMVVGARQGSFYRGSLLKRCLRFCFKFLVEFATGTEIADINSGFRIFKKSICMQFFPAISTGFSFTTTITLLFMLTGKHVEYVEVSYHKRAGKSHVRMMRDGMRAFQFIIEAMLAYNPIKAFLLLACVYIAGLIPVFGFDILLCMVASCGVYIGLQVLIWSVFCLIIGLGFIATSIRLSRVLEK